MRRLRYGIQIFGIQTYIHKEIEGVDPEEWPVIDCVPTYRVEVTSGEDSKLFRKFLEGPNSYSREALEAVLDRIALEIKIHAMNHFDELEKPHNLIDEWNAGKNEVAPQNTNKNIGIISTDCSRSED